MKKIIIATILLTFFAVSSYAVSYETVTIQQGQDLAAIARAHLKDPSMWRELLEYNNITNPSQIRAGVTLRVPYSLSVNRVARITSKIGSVQVQSGSSWSDAYVNQILVQENSIRTGASSRMVLELDDGTVVRIGPNTMIEITGYDYQNGARNTDFDLTSGNAAFRVTRLGSDSDFSVSTVTAVAGVRGTSFYMEVNDENDVGVAVYQGAVGLNTAEEVTTTPAGQTIQPAVVIESGFATTITSAGEIDTPYEIPGRIEWND